MNFELIAIGIVVVAFAYAVCVLIVLAVTFGAGALLGNKLAVKGRLSWSWNVLNISTWLVASAAAGTIVQAQIGPDTRMMTIALAVILFVMQLRSAFVMKRQQSPAVQLVLCILCPLACVVPYIYLP
jgi:hypothetical protein